MVWTERGSVQITPPGNSIISIDRNFTNENSHFTDIFYHARQARFKIILPRGVLKRGLTLILKENYKQAQNEQNENELS